MLSYPIWYWNRWAWVAPTTPRWLQAAQLAWRPLVHTAWSHPRVVRPRQFAPVKRHALQAHASQLDPDDPDAGGEVLDAAWVESFLDADEVFFSEREPDAR